MALLSLGRVSLAGMVRGKSRGTLQEWITLRVLKKDKQPVQTCNQYLLMFFVIFLPFCNFNFRWSG